MTMISKLDAIIFDCDGVLVDISSSYNAAISMTVQYVLTQIFEFDYPNDSIPIDVIEGFKASGGFNDEVDLSYALIISIATALYAKTSITKLLSDVMCNADSGGISTVENYLKKRTDVVNDIIKKIDYPGKSKNQSLLYCIFDEFFYGYDMYKKIRNSYFDNNIKKKTKGVGLINNDKLILDEPLAKQLYHMFDSKMAIVTGRGKISAQYTLKKLLNWFDITNSVFLEDEPRDLAKPNPTRLLDSIRGMHASHVLYVGDSMEDLIMASRASTGGIQVDFCGIVGTSNDPQRKADAFRKNGAILILDSICDLPKALN